MRNILTSILLTSIMSMGFISNSDAQVYFTGVPVDTILAQDTVTDSPVNPCYPWMTINMSFPISGVSGVEHLLIFTNVSVVNSAYIGGIGIINSGDTVPVIPGQNDFQIYFPTGGSATWKFKAVGIPLICGEVHGCDLGMVYFLAECFGGPVYSFEDSCKVNCVPDSFVPPVLPDLTDPCSVELPFPWSPESSITNNCGNVAIAMPNSPIVITTTGTTVVTWSYFRDTLLFTATQNVIIGSFSTISASACSSFTSPSGNYTWTSSGTYQDTIPNYMGCDSVITINLTIGQALNAINPVDCNSYTSPSGNYTWTSSGSYVDTIPAVGGCDSIIAVNLNVGNSFSVMDAYSCSGSFTSPSGNYTWINSGTYQDTIPNTAGCDSIITVNLTVGLTTTSIVNEITCCPYTSPSGNYTWSMSGIYIDTISNAAGCDSVITVNLTINNSGFVNQSVNACESYTSPSGNYTWTTSGIYYDTVSMAAGCNIYYTIYLDINEMFTIYQYACDSYTSPSGNHTWTTSGIYVDTVPSFPFCDGIIFINLTIYSSSSNTIYPTVCNSYTSPSGNYTWTSSGVYSDTIPNFFGCDSIITVNLTINNNNSGTDEISACDSYTWIDGNIYTSSNNSATWIVTNAAGCDSVVTLDLTITNSSSGTDLITACDSYTWIDGNTYTSSNNSATWIVTNAVGCDSLVTLDLTITNSSLVMDVITACDSYTWIDGNTYTVSNNSATLTLTNAVGCDSIVTLDLTITNSSSGTDEITACDSYTWIDGNTYTSSNNSATWTVTNASGCDSIVTLDLTITNSSSGTDVITACDTYTWIDGNTYTSSNNTATWTLTNAAGCDSVVTLDLTITNSSSGTDIITACDSYIWIDGNTYTSSNNSATWTLTNVAGCDSLVTLDLTINTVDVSLTNTSPTLTANASGSTYQWLDCDNGMSIINGENGQSFTSTVNGSYAVEVTQNGCVDTSACEVVDNIGILENDFGTMLLIYPNPNDGIFTIDLGSSYSNITLIVNSEAGQEVSRKEFRNAEKFQVSLPKERGTYFVEVNTSQKQAVVKVIRN